MTQGGARNRSGPAPDPSSGRSDRRGLTFDQLPAEGYAGEVPDFPLPKPLKRELAVWAEAWTTPQAAAWAREPWRQRTVAQWVRWSVRAEDREAPASLIVAVVRLADQIGMTPAGLRENGWQITRDEVEQKRGAAESQRPKRRLRAVAGDD